MTHSSIQPGSAPKPAQMGEFEGGDASRLASEKAEKTRREHAETAVHAAGHGLPPPPAIPRDPAPE